MTKQTKMVIPRTWPRCTGHEAISQGRFTARFRLVVDEAPAAPGRGDLGRWVLSTVLRCCLQRPPPRSEAEAPALGDHRQLFPHVPERPFRPRPHPFRTVTLPESGANNPAGRSGPQLLNFAKRRKLPGPHCEPRAKVDTEFGHLHRAEPHPDSEDGTPMH